MKCAAWGVCALECGHCFGLSELMKNVALESKNALCIQVYLAGEKKCLRFSFGLIPNFCLHKHAK